MIKKMIIYIFLIQSIGFLQAKESDLIRLGGIWGDLDLKTREYMDVNEIVIKNNNNNYNLYLYDYDNGEEYDDIDINCDHENVCSVFLKSKPDNIFMIFKIEHMNQLRLLKYTGKLVNFINGGIFVRESAITRRAHRKPIPR